MLTLVVHLFAHPGRLAALRAYERKALEILRTHGGEILAAFAPDAVAGETPDEIQVLRFPDRTAYDAFLADPARKALAGERDAAVRGTQIFTAATLITY